MALGFIGLSAGGKLHLNDVRENLRASMSVLSGLVGVTYVGSIASTLLFGPTFLPFMREMDFAQRLSAALLIACLAVARSPSSAIAIIEEMNAKGPFTTTILTVTVLIDVVVVLLFALTTLVVNALLNDDGSGGGGASLLVDFIKQTALSVVIGIFIGRVLPLIYACDVSEQAAGRFGAAGGAAVLCALLCGGVSVLMVLLQRLVFLGLGWVFFLDEQYEVTRIYIYKIGRAHV